ncbi:hypothetical protein PGT21_006697 [Puccinia graminis f. sp. tritici]|uniref:Retrotransposon gag domain-containing protein n=1 Tax=Puccinia graminis f. sp. tritici TaxID=56615 RepID=A0A5B0Q9P1_PUCGR|nr:hypothetical protein PGT21_006697 [Puccinia graminis f. sp. tritici]
MIAIKIHARIRSTVMSFPDSSSRNAFGLQSTHPLISPFESPSPNVYVATSSQRDLPPLSPMPDDFQPRPIPSPSPSIPFPSLLPNRQDHQQGVSNILSSLQIENPDRDQTILSHSQSIASLELQARRNEENLRKNDATIKELSQLLVFASDFTKMKMQVSKEFLQVRTSSDTANGSTNSRLAALEGHANSASKFHPDPPHYSHLSFSGEISETHQFCYFIQDAFARIPHHFETDCDRILWISSYFRTVSGRLGEPCPSYAWWRGLLTCNADAQGLPTLAPFVLPELMNSDAFLNLIESHFSSSTEEEDARKAFFALRQGSSSVSDFNIQFNTLLYSVDLSPKSALEDYERAINQKIVELGIQRGGWSELANLEDMQRMAVKLSLDVGRVNQIIQRKFTFPPPRVEYRAPGPAPVVAKPSQAVPMDIDSVLASVGFTWPAWRKACTDRKTCFRCLQPFDQEHVDHRGCPLPELKWLKKESLLPFWKEWGGKLREDDQDQRVSSRYTPLS